MLSREELRTDIPGWTVEQQNELAKFDRNQHNRDIVYYDNNKLEPVYDPVMPADSTGMDVPDIAKELGGMELSDIHKSVLMSIAAGLSDGEIATLLNRSVRTVERLRLEAKGLVSAHYRDRDQVVKLVDGCRE